MMLTPLNVAPFVPTDKRAGDIVIHSHQAFKVRDDGSWRPLEEADTTPSCAAVQHERRWWVWAVCGVGIGLLVVLHFAGRM